jgi:hypothetical protein
MQPIILRRDEDAILCEEITARRKLTPLRETPVRCDNLLYKTVLSKC